ncbi:MAG TPA: DUF4185 domain-containing protein [Acidobacteriaceae bacterium]|jgi:hypothetical protein|nr:DUF4185 domain-containing protein [Acidobacteriaceae bacterium]
MTRRWLRAMALAGFVVLAGSGAWAHGEDAGCTPEFPLQQGIADGWLGADAAYSIPLNTGYSLQLNDSHSLSLHGGRDVWIFGDTLYGEHRVVQGTTPQMVRNSIGISTCAHRHWKLQYVIRKDADGHPVSFFTPQHPNTWYWALDGFVAGHDLWVTLLCVRDAPAASAAMGFASCGTDLARIASPGPDPQKWKIDYFPLVPDGAHAYPSATAVVDDGDAYIFALNEKGSRPLEATRIPLDGLSDPQKNLQYLTSDMEWKPGFDPSTASEVMHQGSPELSIRWHPEFEKWLAVMFAPDAFSSKIVLRTANSLIGPWSDGQVIYTVPEMQPTTPGYDKNTFCYAAKEHPEFEHNDLVFTYVCNTFDVPKLATNTEIYFPRVIRMPMPALQ